MWFRDVKGLDQIYALYEEQKVRPEVWFRDVKGLDQIYALYEEQKVRYWSVV